MSLVRLRNVTSANYLQCFSISISNDKYLVGYELCAIDRDLRYSDDDLK